MHIPHPDPDASPAFPRDHLGREIHDDQRRASADPLTRSFAALTLVVPQVPAAHAFPTCPGPDSPPPCDTESLAAPQRDATVLEPAT